MSCMFIFDSDATATGARNLVGAVSPSRIAGEEVKFDTAAAATVPSVPPLDDLALALGLHSIIVRLLRVVPRLPAALALSRPTSLEETSFVCVLWVLAQMRGRICRSIWRSRESVVRGWVDGM